MSKKSQAIQYLQTNKGPFGEFAGFYRRDVKKYKSHRRLSYSINLFTIEDEYFKKKNRKWLTIDESKI